jgi:hypothetical protein
MPTRTRISSEQVVDLTLDGLHDDVGIDEPVGGSPARR